MISPKMIFNSIFSFVLLLPIMSFAQEKDCACCDVQHDQFDFWIGEWVVKNSKGEIIGYNTIEELEENCLISEQWSGVNNSSGRSFNYYDPEENTWNQLWISNSGNILKLEGRLENGRMVMTGPMVTNEKGTYRDQIIWIPNDDGTVIQKWNVLPEGGEKSETVFLGIYHRQQKE